MLKTKNRGAHLKEIYFILSIVLVVLTTLFSIWGPGGYLEMKKVEAELRSRRARVETLQEENQARLVNIQALRSNREALEKYAREKGYIRKGEIIQQLPQEPPPPKN